MKTSLRSSIIFFVFFIAMAAQPLAALAAVDEPCYRWVKTHVSAQTGMPYSFQIISPDKTTILKEIGSEGSVSAIIERMIVQDGISIYDAALYQIVLTALGNPDDLRDAETVIQYYWNGALGGLHNIRAGNGSQPFVYDPKRSGLIEDNVSLKGERGYLFRILNANGVYELEDPLDGRTHCPFFPNNERIHWEDWKPISGENAWVAMAALHLFHQQYYDREKKAYSFHADSAALGLAEELARVALILQADNGGIRMAPLGTFYHLDGIDPRWDVAKIQSVMDERIKSLNKSELKDTPYHRWYYKEISTENNLSWYAAFRMLYRMTGKEIYAQAMRRQEEYFRSVWDAQAGCLYQGAHFIDGKWIPNRTPFAVDVQNWAIIVLGPERLDEWFGPGAALRIWRSVKERSGYVAGETLQGVGFSDEHDQISVEWSAGALLALTTLQKFYDQKDLQIVQEVKADFDSIRQGIDALRFSAGDGLAGYAYSLRRKWIPFGWFSHDPGILSLASTCWVLMIDNGMNPFILEE